MFLADTGALIDDTLWSQLHARMPIFRFASNVPTCCTRSRGPRNPRESCECVQVSDTRAWCPSSVSLRSLLVQPTYNSDNHQHHQSEGGQGCYRLTRGGTGPSQFRAWVALATGARFPLE